MKPLLVFSKFSPSASRSDDLIVTLGSRRMLAGAFPSGKKRQPAASSSLLILIRAVASLFAIRFPIPPELVKRYYTDYEELHGALPSQVSLSFGR